jgi:hypothetical protein
MEGDNATAVTVRQAHQRRGPDGVPDNPHPAIRGADAPKPRPFAPYAVMDRRLHLGGGGFAFGYSRSRSATAQRVRLSRVMP